MNEWNWGWLCVLTQATRNLRIVWVISMENIQLANSRFSDKFISYYRQPISRAIMSICDARFEAAVTHKRNKSSNQLTIKFNGCSNRLLKCRLKFEKITPNHIRNIRVSDLGRYKTEHDVLYHAPSVLVGSVMRVTTWMQMFPTWSTGNMILVVMTKWSTMQKPWEKHGCLSDPAQSHRPPGIVLCMETTWNLFNSQYIYMIYIHTHMKLITKSVAEEKSSIFNITCESIHAGGFMSGECFLQ